MGNIIDDLIDLSGGNVNKMFNIITGGRQSGKTYTQKQMNKSKKNVKQVEIRKTK